MAETERTGLLRRILGGQRDRTGPGLGGYGYNDASSNRVGALRDMFDGGGRGQSGPRFEGGGMFSAAGNAFARPAGSRERGGPDMRTGLGGFARDMVDGGGFGQSGPTFQGGMYGGLLASILNQAGVRPMGYMERPSSARPQMRPQMASAPAAAAYSAPAAAYRAPAAPAQSVAMQTPSGYAGFTGLVQPALEPGDEYALPQLYSDWRMRAPAARTAGYAAPAYTGFGPR